MTAIMNTPRTIGLILAGGRSRRMGTDKAFVPLAGRPLLSHVIERLAPQVEALAISSNAPAARFAAFGLPVLPDVFGGFRGPLAGIHAGLRAFPDAVVVSVAVDLPRLPRDLVARLRHGWDGAHCRFAASGERGGHALAILWPPGLAGPLAQFLKQNRRGVSDWLARHGEPVAIPVRPDADLGLNINTLTDLIRAQALVADSGR